jgi:Immunoglobulin-like domain of bacterial spore germination
VWTSQYDNIIYTLSRSLSSLKSINEEKTMKNILWKQKHRSIVLSLLLLLVISLAACSYNGVGNSSDNGSSTPTATATTVAKTTPTSSTSAPSPTPTIQLGAQSCPDAVKNPTYWEPIISPYAYGGQHHVEQVSCANIIGNPSLQALVTVRRVDTSDTLDVFVFNNITNAKPSLIFRLMGLVKGDAKISRYNTVMTVQADELSTINAGKDPSAMTADLYREYKWSADSGTLSQTAFPGIFPDLTRYQAEADQASVNQGHQPWKLSATQVSNFLAVSLLNWSTNSTTTLLSGGGAHDVSAVVRVRSTDVVSGYITVTLSRLEGNTNNGIWEAIAVASNGMSITSPAPLAQFRSPVQVTGTGNAFEGQIGQVFALDHLYHSLGQASATGAVGEGQTTFSTTLSFQSTFPAGIQEGVLVLYARSNANGSIAGAVMVKVLINGAP